MNINETVPPSMVPCHRTQVEILSTWEVRSLIEIRIERLLLGPFSYYINSKTSNSHKHNGSRAPFVDLECSSKSFDTQNNDIGDKLLGFRILGRLTTGNRLLCSPVFSDVGHLESLLNMPLLGSLGNLADKGTPIHVVNFSSVLSFPFRIADLTLFSSLGFSIFCTDLGLCLGHLSLQLFGSNGILRQGRLLLPFGIHPSSESPQIPCQLEPFDLNDTKDSRSGSSQNSASSEAGGEKITHKNNQASDSDSESGTSSSAYKKSKRSTASHQSSPKVERTTCISESVGSDDKLSDTDSDVVWVSGLSLSSWSSETASSENSSETSKSSLSSNEELSKFVFLDDKGQQQSSKRRSRSYGMRSDGEYHPALPNIPRPKGWVRVRSFSAVRRATFKALNSYKLLDLLERGAVPQIPDDRGKKQVQNLCERNLLRALECFGFVGIALPTFSTPVIFSLPPHPNTVLLSSLNQSAVQRARFNEITDLSQLFLDSSLGAAWRESVLTAAKSVVLQNSIECQSPHQIATRTLSQPIRGEHVRQQQVLQSLSAPSSPPVLRRRAMTGLTDTKHTSALHQCWDLGHAPHLLDYPNAAEQRLLEQQRRLVAGGIARDLQTNQSDKPDSSKYLLNFGYHELSPTLFETQLALSIVTRPVSTPLSAHNKQLLWRHRDFLRKRGLGLVKLAASRDPSSKSSDDFAALLENWPKPNIEGVLGLLTPFSRHPAVRKFAVGSLEDLTDAEVTRYMPQLIQAVRFEEQGVTPGLLCLLNQRAANSAVVASQLHWSLACESDESSDNAHLFIRGQQQLLNALANAGPLPQRIWKVIELQKKLVRQLRQLSAQIRERHDRADRKTLRLRSLLSSKNDKRPEDLNLQELEVPVPLPIKPHYILLGIDPDESFVVRSTQYPLVLHCRVLVPMDGEDYGWTHWGMQKEELKERGFREITQKYMYKFGDDLRQDQLVTQFISIMNDLLCSYGNDYCLTVYRVFALSRIDGFIEYIEKAESLSSIRRIHPTIRQFFSSCVSDFVEGHTRIPNLLDRFIRSCSAFSVITFLLGVGDRHLDNLMVNEDGRLFHVDFGFILGEDPKPFPPPMKLCGEIIEALGGLGSPQYIEFQLRCCHCYRCLRRHSDLFINMLLLMANSGIRCLKADPFAVIGRVQEKFQLDSSEAEAEAYLLDVVSVSANALFPAVVDKFHEWTVYWK